MAKTDDTAFKIEFHGDCTDDIAAQITEALKQRLASKSRMDDLRAAANAAMKGHLETVDDDASAALAQKIHDACQGFATADVLMALAQIVVNVIGDRQTPDEVRETVATSPLSPEEKERALEQGLHEAECWECFNHNVSVRVGAFALLLGKIATALTGGEPDAPDHVKKVMKDLTDRIEGRDPHAKHN